MNDVEKRSYALGCDVGNNFKMMNLSIEKDSFAQGVMDALVGKIAMTDAELSAQFELINKELEERQRKQASAEKEAGEKFLAENKVKDGVVTTASGLQYKVITMGTGVKPSATETVKVHYHGTLIDGTVFDSSVQRGEPIEFPLNRVIKGWTEGLQLMPVGSKFIFYIPSDLAYGEASPSPLIKPNSTLIFEVELLDVRK
jgi:FKBP-type peptidyl-prolyl cis-trans isomerase